jgi:hypothetical protein
VVKHTQNMGGFGILDQKRNIMVLASHKNDGNIFFTS